MKRRTQHVSRMLEHGAMLGWGMVSRHPDEPYRARFYKANAYYVVWVIEGEGRYRDASHDIPLQAGAVVHRMPGIEHELLFSTRWLEIYVRLPVSACSMLDECGILTNDGPVWQLTPDKEITQAWMGFGRELQLATAATMPLVLSEIVAHVSLCARLHRQRSTVDSVTQAVERGAVMLELDLAQERSLPEVAKACGLPYGTFRKAFHARYQLSPKAYRDRMRMIAARARLLDGQPAQAVASELGFSCIAAFSRRFRAEHGSGPRAWLAEHR